MDGIRKVKRKVLKAIDRTEGEDGTTLEEISEEADLSEEMTRKAVYQLNEEDKVYEPVYGRFKHMVDIEEI